MQSPPYITERDGGGGGGAAGGAASPAVRDTAFDCTASDEEGHFDHAHNVYHGSVARIKINMQQIHLKS
jgi:hypothetical protein